MIQNLFRRQFTIKDLIDIDTGRVERSKNLKVRLDKIFDIVKEETWFDKFISFFKNKPRLIYYKLFRFKVKSDSGSEYTVFIKVSPSFDSQKFLRNKVQVFCSCPDFKYRSAYSLNRVSNLYLNKATQLHLGEATKIAPTKIETTNICKHVYATFIYFRANLRNYGLIRPRT